MPNLQPLTPDLWVLLCAAMHYNAGVFFGGGEAVLIDPVCCRTRSRPCNDC